MIDMQQYIARPELLAAATGQLSEAPVVALLGARQVGKTTLAEQVVSGWPGPFTVFDLEVATTREALSVTPEKLLRESEGLVVLDEVQRMPELFEILRPICDSRNRKAVFLLLGSASWDLIKGVSETLAGRILFVDVGGFSLAEVGPQKGPALDTRRFSTSLAGAVSGGMDTLDAVLYTHISGAGHSRPGVEGIS